MKKLIVTLLGVCVASSALAQGYFNFANGVPGVNAQIKDAGGANAVGPNYVAVLYYGTGVIANPGLLAEFAASETAFATGASAGYFFGGNQTLPVTGTITAQIRTFNTTDPLEIGLGNLIQIDLAQGGAPAPNMAGITPFQMVIVPEPSTFALAGLGAAALLIFRRRD